MKHGGVTGVSGSKYTAFEIRLKLLSGGQELWPLKLFCPAHCRHILMGFMQIGSLLLNSKKFYRRKTCITYHLITLVVEMHRQNFHPLFLFKKKYSLVLAQCMGASPSMFELYKTW